MEINSRGKAVDGRGRDVLIIESNLPGRYPVLGVQLRNSGKGISKGGLRKYTRSGKYYANGSDELDLVDFTSDPDMVLGEEVKRVVTLVKGSESASVVEDSELYDTLIELGFDEESSDD